LKISTGDFITFVDSDDYVNKDFISTLVNLIQDFEADIAISPFIHFKDDEKK
jgi:cellulose synthase/poly-beta-1,6-N-acetylglucosamine synthase-like glycosyltransferase